MTNTTDQQQPQAGEIPNCYPPPHTRYLVARGGYQFVATPCYGMHSPWWVAMVTDAEVHPVAMASGDTWIALATVARQAEQIERLEKLVAEREDVGTLEHARQHIGCGLVITSKDEQIERLQRVVDATKFDDVGQSDLQIWIGTFRRQYGTDALIVGWLIQVKRALAALEAGR